MLSEVLEKQSDIHLTGVFLLVFLAALIARSGYTHQECLGMSKGKVINAFCHDYLISLLFHQELMPCW